MLRNLADPNRMIPAPRMRHIIASARMCRLNRERAFVGSFTDQHGFLLVVQSARDEAKAIAAHEILLSAYRVLATARPYTVTGPTTLRTKQPIGSCSTQAEPSSSSHTRRSRHGNAS